MVYRRGPDAHPKAPAPAVGKFVGGHAAEVPDSRAYQSQITAGWMEELE